MFSRLLFLPSSTSKSSWYTAMEFGVRWGYEPGIDASR
jgi:hypothetical protein